MAPISFAARGRKAGPKSQQQNWGSAGVSNVTSRVTSETHSSKPVNKGRKRKFVEIVHNEERELSEDELKDFDGYKHFGEFLRDLDPMALSLKVQKQQRNPSESSRIHTPHGPENLASFREEFAASDVEELSRHIQSSSNTSSDTSDALDKKIRAQKHKVVEYEHSPRSFTNNSMAQDSLRLPIKLSNGRVQAVPNSSVPDHGLEDRSGYLVTPRKDEQYQELTTCQPMSICTPGERLKQTQEQLAKVALDIIEDPEENIGQISRLREIQNSGRSIEQRFAILTLSTVFRDIIPGYRIRPLTDIEKAEKITKEVRRLRNFEQVLIEQYHLFVTSLVSLSKTSRKDTSPNSSAMSLKTTAITAACTLLEAVPHFNFRTELFSILASQVSRRRVDALFIRCRDTIEALFRNDGEGEVAFEGMRILCKKMKERDYHIDQSTIGTFLHLRLLNEMDARGSSARVDREKRKKKDRQFRTKKLKKFMKDQKDVEKDMEEAQATVNTEVRERLQGDTLKLVFATYFRILKERNSAIVGSALEGLAKFANLINVDFFGDLLEILKEVMSEELSENLELNTRDVLLCIVTAFTMLSGQASSKETINLDLSMFLNRLYQILLPISLDAAVELSKAVGPLHIDADGRQFMRSKVNVATATEMVLRTLDAAFFQNRNQSVNRLGSFVKRLLSITLHLPEKSSIAIMEINKRLLSRYGKLHALWSTEESAGDGNYDGYTDDYELSNSATTSVWETSLLRKHFSPKVKQAGNAILDTLLEAAKASH